MSHEEPQDATCPTPPLSVVIPTHNRPDLLRACLAGVTRCAPPRTEILVVDDASPEGTAAAVAADFAGVRVVHLPQQCGFCAAANAGLAAARGAVVELLNDDTEVCPGWADAALAHFEDPGVGAVAPLVLRWPGADAGGVPRIDSAGDRYFLGGVAAKRGHGEPLGPAYLVPCRVFGASGSSAFYRTEAVRQVGGLPECFGAYFEDVDLSFRLHRAGLSVVYEPASRVLHHVSASHGPPQGRLLEQQSLNEERVFWRNVPARALLRAVPLHLAVLAGKAWRRWREGTLLPFLRGRCRLLAEVPQLFRHRRRLAAFGPAGPLNGWQVEGRYWGAGGQKDQRIPVHFS